ncbi:hypothetical protein X801_06717 [Opisthorchis viverrini]|uniref:Uncharacterized protein n=1 Tax=Opisthorchis viverrini TaxID=6198 RepID=A0A1S8WSZ0_OPIVI|nr:hypothetical protein X801_06717 [Opisthorchis viverrini]
MTRFFHVFETLQNFGGIGVSFGRCSPTHRSNDPRRQQMPKSSRSADLPESQLSSHTGTRVLSTSQSGEQVDANQIPGYQPICVGNLPDWKLQKLERKNREAAHAYADAGLGSPCCDIRPEQHASLISAELTAKLQRRLEKVDSVPTS